jgi:MinD-like ATPase involved in chromosome partitioning or flagellar assembly
LEPSAKGILRLSDQIVLVTEPALDSVRAASSTLDWLAENGHDELVGGAVAVVNSVSRHAQLEIPRVVEQFATRCRAVVEVPWDPHLQAGAETIPDRLKRSTHDAYLRLAAAVADGFAPDPTPVRDRSR